jgi:hypothetical protein
MNGRVYYDVNIRIKDYVPVYPVPLFRLRLSMSVFITGCVERQLVRDLECVGTAL